MSKILLVAGESSGDLHASLLAKELKLSRPDIALFACGGMALASQGIPLIADLVSLSVLGGAEVMKNYFAIRKIFARALDFLDREKPQAVILVDYPGFNLRLAAQAKARGIRVIYYVSPQIWAWAHGRIRTIRKLVDGMLVLFPFEKEIYDRAGVPVCYVGHPSLDRTVGLPSRTQWLSAQGLASEKTYLALLPGSRSMEIRNLLPVLLDAAAIIAESRPDLAFLLPCASAHLRPIIENQVRARRLPIAILDGQSMEAAGASALALVASGTATLETALMGTPLLIVYKVHPLTYWIARMLVRLPYLGLVNVLAGKGIAPEFLQERAKGPLLAQEALALLADAERMAQMKKQFFAIRQNLGEAGASRRAADAVLEFLQGRQSHAALS